jgi:hypothetical protein
MSDREQRQLHDLFLAYKAAVIPIIIVDSNGDAGIGTCFHVGERVFVTARHVVENNRRTSVLGQDVTDFKFHRDKNIDVAAFRMPQLREALPAIPLGDHLDDWINDDDFVLSRALILGYPPIPMARSAMLVAQTAEVNAVVDLLPPNRNVHFIISAMARGGFSGGPVISEWGFALGLTTSSLVRNGEPEQLGHYTLVGIEPIYVCLHENGLLPKDQGSGLLVFDR